VKPATKQVVVGGGAGALGLLLGYRLWHHTRSHDRVAMHEGHRHHEGHGEGNARGEYGEKHHHHKKHGH
jgi:ketopantoate reductase